MVMLSELTTLVSVGVFPLSDISLAVSSAHDSPTSCLVACALPFPRIVGSDQLVLVNRSHGVAQPFNLLLHNGCAVLTVSCIEEGPVAHRSFPGFAARQVRRLKLNLKIQ